MHWAPLIFSPLFHFLNIMSLHRSKRLIRFNGPTILPGVYCYIVCLFPVSSQIAATFPRFYGGLFSLSFSSLSLFTQRRITEISLYNTRTDWKVFQIIYTSYCHQTDCELWINFFHNLITQVKDSVVLLSVVFLGLLSHSFSFVLGFRFNSINLGWHI